ncbi:MAG TPA: NAD-dependent epimerase/dehydratase family protein [Pseudonocardiaceae bacterium]|jgi:UDP-glucose 4-epimerase|nr:NAD-dependent epimerase/dehydratase family protein [Pseudonocardiaceae bacterium]
MSPSTVLVTGVSRFVGGQLAARLAADPSIDRVLGVDIVPPGRDLLRRMGRAEFVRADLRNPLIAKVISTAKVDTVVHASMSANPRDSGGRSAMKEMNVIGTMQLLAACQKSTTVTRLVVKSTSAVYGVSPRDPAMFTERDEPKDLPASGYAKDAVEIEGYVRGFARRRQDVDVTVLRFTNFIGPRIDSALTRFFALPVVPMVLGYDPRVQLLHEEDALAVLERAAREPLPGVVNVGGDGVLLLSQAIRRAGRIPAPVPEPAVATVGRLLRSSQLIDYSPEQTRFLNFGRVLDTTRLRTEFGFTPRWTTVQAFDDFVRGRALRPTIDPKRVAAAERGLLKFAALLC